MRFDHRPRKVRMIADDEAMLRGAGVVIERKKRNLRSIKPPARVPQDRRVYDAKGNLHPRFNVRAEGRRIIVVAETPSKRARLAAGAEYAETWQTSHAAPSDGFKGIAQKGAGDHVELAS